MTVASGLGMGLSISARYITYLCTFWANAYALTLGGDKKIYGLGIRRKMWYGIMILRKRATLFPDLANEEA